MSDPRIVCIEYQMPRAKPVGFADPMPRIVATFDDGAPPAHVHSSARPEQPAEKGVV